MMSVLAALACVSGLAGCRQVTEVSFRLDGDPAQIQLDELVVDLHGVNKQSHRLQHLTDTIGLYGLTGPSIDITVWGCSSAHIQVSNERDARPYLLVSDSVVITLSPYHGTPMTPCPDVVDGGVVGEPGSEGGMTGAGGMGGEGGMTGAGGMGGETILGAGGSTDAGAGGAGGADAGTNGCGGTGAGGAIDAGTCDPPSGQPDVPAIATLNLACNDYCNAMMTACSNSYADVTECERYCTLVGWAPGSGSLDRNNTIACRASFEAMAADNPTQAIGYCKSAGPASTDCSQASGGMCNTFCTAWAGICGGSITQCQTACAALPDVTCRFSWLLLASGDRRYCPLVDVTTAATSCRPPGC